MADTRRRVKLYALNADRQWDDRGTGHVSSSYVERLKAMSLLVRAESDGSLLLESKIQQDTAYQKQQETLIVWSEGDNYDLALSFQEKAGCDEIWEKICQVQGKDPSVDITQDVVESEDEHLEDGGAGGDGGGLPPVELPPCETQRLGELAALVQSCLPSPVRRDKLATALEEQDYIRRLLPVFHTCEDLDYREGLYQLYDIFKGIFLLNKNALFDAMFAEDAILDVVGILEYEPGCAPGQRRRHRDYLRQVSRFREVIPLGNPELLAKIHQTYRVQYIQDVVLPTPSVFEENMLSTLSSFIFFNKADIVSMLQEDEKFLSELFAQLTDDATDDDKRRDLVLFLKEFCTFSQTLQPQCRESFFKTLSSLGILQALEITLGMDDGVIKTASIDILSYLVDYSPSMVREYAFQQSNVQDDDQLLINIIIDQMVCDPDPDLGGAVQLSGILRLLLDPENMLSLDTSEFLNFFYKHCMHVLIAPVLANTTGEAPSKETSQTAQLLGLIVELLSFCVEHHSYHIKNYVLHKDLLRRVLVLMRSKFTFLVLCALRFMRRIVGLKDEFYNRYIINGNLFGPVVDAFRHNNGRYNLLDSAVLELFEFIRVDDVKSLCLHVVERYGKVLDKVEYVQTFKSLRLRYEQHQERLRERPSLEGSILRGAGGGGAGGGVVPGATLGPAVGGGPLGAAARFRRDPRQLEEDEEMWFNEEEEEEEELEGPPGAVAPADSFSRRLDAEFDQLGKILDKKAQEREGKENVRTLNRSGSPVLNNSPGRRSPSNPAGPLSPTTVVEVKSPTGSLQRKGGLVDYPDEDSDEEEEEEDEGGVTTGGLPSAKRPRLSS